VEVGEVAAVCIQALEVEEAELELQLLRGDEVLVLCYLEVIIVHSRGG
jgi:hypothetical protein